MKVQTTLKAGFRSTDLAANDSSSGSGSTNQSSGFMRPSFGYLSA